MRCITTLTRLLTQYLCEVAQVVYFNSVISFVKRKTTRYPSTARKVSLLSFSCKRNAVHERADVSNSDFHRISWDKIPCWLHGKAYSCRASCQNHTPCLKSGTLTA